MENSKQNDMFQIKNLIKEFNNNIIQINEKIIIINNIITQINNIMNKNKDNVKQIENFMEMMNNFKMNPNDYMFQLDKKFEPNIKKIEKIESLNKYELDVGSNIFPKNITLGLLLNISSIASYQKILIIESLLSFSIGSLYLFLLNDIVVYFSLFSVLSAIVISFITLGLFAF